VRIATMVDLASLGLRDQNLTAGLLNSPHFDAMQQRLQRGLDRGALGLGFGINYTAGATRDEIYRMFQLARANDVTAFAHPRFMAERELVNGVFVVRDGEPQRNQHPGQVVRRGK
jgi:N-acyl-D-aspartate/D-glutamate deacylase